MKIIALLVVLLICSVGLSGAATVYVDTVGGDYTCDGTNDHVQINQALAFVGTNASYDTVHLNGTNTYWINSTLDMYGDTIFEGDSDAEIKLVNEAGLSYLVPLISNTTSGSNNFTIQRFEIDGNSENQSVSLGAGYHNMMYFKNCYNVTVTDMRLEWGCCDGLKVEHTSGDQDSAYVTFTNNSVYKLGHDALYVMRLNNVIAADNDVFTRTNSAFRLSGSNTAKIYNNIIHSEFAGWSTGPGIQVGSGYTNDDIEIYNNTIYNLNGAGIWLDGHHLTATDVYIHHNIFYDVGQYWYDTGHSNAAIIIGQFNNTIIENNVMDDGGYAGIKHYIYGETIDGTFTTIVRNNIIMNADDHTAAGLWNYDDTNHIFISEYNCIYGNTGGAYNGTNITHSNDIYVDPLFVDTSNRDYHLKSKAGTWNPTTLSWDIYNVHLSPCVDAGNESSDYSNEPYPNGGRINIGAYGNAVYASKSDTFLSVDNSIKSSSPDSVYSNLPYLHVGQMGSTKYRSWIWFDLSEYAPTENIDSAILNMTWYYNTDDRNKTTNVGIYFPNVTVDTNYLSWNCSDNDTTWSNQGGDWLDANNVSMGNTPFDNVTFPNTAPDMAQHSWNLTSLVQSIVNGTRTNNGFFIIADETNSNYIAFSSLDNETAGDRPTLTITASNYTRVEFIAPTLTNESVTNDDYVKINASIELESISLDSFIWNWNGTNTTLLNDSCVMYLSLDNNSAIGDSSTVVVDVSPVHINGSFENGVNGTWTDDGAMHFDGTNDEGIKFVDSPNINDDQLSIIAVINLTSYPASGEYGIIHHKIGGWYFQIDDIGELMVFLYGTTNPGYHVTSIKVPLQTEVGVATTYNGTNVTLYINDLYELFANTGNIISTADSYIGGDRDGRPLNGSIYEIQEHRRWLNNAEIEQIGLSSLYKHNSTQWYFSSNQTNLSEGEYNYQIFANNVESDYRVVTYSAPPTDVETFVVPIAAFAAVVFASAVVVSKRVRRGISGFWNRRIRRR